MGKNGAFIPPICLRSMYAQTILASSKVRTLGGNPMLSASRELILDAGEGVRLQGFHSPQLHPQHKGLVILLHGWEGSSNSTYILHAGKHLYRNGYSVFRLNFRDHGESHHLNEGVFYSTLLDEVFEAIKIASELSDGKGVFLAGFSLGGNFALRAARRLKDCPIENIRHVMAISPVLNPNKSTDAIDRTWLLRNYFLKKWRRSLSIKQRLYPHLYDFSDMMSLSSIRATTDALISWSDLYKNTEEYFDGYTLKDHFFKDIPVPLTIVSSRDDPVIPADDFYNLHLNGNTDLVVHDYGGHNGFIYGVFSSTWYERRMIEVFDNVV